MRRRLVLLIAVAGLSLGVGVPAASAAWGAIAINVQTGATGHSSNYNSAGPAKRRARHECGQGCQLIAAVRNGYAAVVKTSHPDGRVSYSGGYGRTKAAAFRSARKTAHDSSARRYTSVFSGY